MTQIQIGRLVAAAALAVCAATAQPKKGEAAAQPPMSVMAQQPDAERTKEELSNLLGRYPPALRGVLAIDPALLGNESYLATYPALLSFLNEHSEVARNPTFYVGDESILHPRDRDIDVMENVLAGLAVLCGIGMAAGLIVWLTRMVVDYKRWSRLAEVQTDAHSKLLDRFTANEDLLAYIKSPPGAKFLESSPIMLDAAPRSVGAPLGRILWSVQGGVVLIAGGIGLQFVSAQVASGASQSLRALGVLSLAVGVGFVVSAIVSYAISRQLGLIEPGPAAPRAEIPGI